MHCNVEAPDALGSYWYKSNMKDQVLLCASLMVPEKCFLRVDM